MTKSVYFQSGNVFRPSAYNPTVNMLPTGTYVVRKDMQGYYLELIDSFTNPSKVYGDVNSRATRILRTFADRPKATGALLVGEKGSGKSLLARQVSIDAAKQGIPTIVINEPHCGDSFNKFLQDISQPAVVLMDEFEKTYDKSDQEQVLTLLDGVFSSKKLFLLTSNSMWAIDRHMRNRPGRLFYVFEYAGISEQFIRDYCVDNLKDQKQIQSVVRVSKVFTAFNFDMLTALVEEMNRYDESAAQAMQYLNVRPGMDEVCRTFTLSVAFDDPRVTSNPNAGTTVEANPTSPGGSDIRLPFRAPNEEGVIEDDQAYVRVTFEDALGDFPRDDGTYVFSKEVEYVGAVGTTRATITLTPKAPAVYRYIF